MAKKKTEVQLKFEANTAEFNTSIKKMNSDINLLNNQLKLNATQLKGNSDNLDLLNQRQDLLTIELQKSSQKVDDTNNKLNEAKKLFGDNSQEVRNLTNDLLRAQNQEQAVKNELDSVNNKIDDVTNSMKENETEVEESLNAYDKLTKEISNQEQELQELKKSYSNSILELGETATETQELKQKLSNLNDELEENKTKLSNVDKASSDVTNSFDDLEQSTKEAEDGFTIFKGILADLGSNVIQGVIGSMRGLVDSVFDTVESTQEYRSMMGKLEGATQNFGYSIDFTSQQFDTFYSYLGDNQMATNAITNLMGLGLETDKVSRLAEGAIGVWASYGDSIPIESLTESINETIQVGKVTGTMADTINWAKVSNEDFAKALGNGSAAQQAFNKAIKDGEATEDAFSAALAATSDTQERANIVANFLNNTYGQSKKTYDELNGSMIETNSTQNELQQTQAEIAETITPLQNKFTELKSQGLETLAPVLENVVDGLFDFGEWCGNNQSTIEVIGAILGGLATSFVLVNGAVGAYNIVMPIYTAITTGASISTTALGGAIAFLTSPITIAIVAIGALIAIGVLLWKNWDTVKEKAGELKDNVVQKITDLKDGAVEKFKGIFDFIKGNWQGILMFIANPIVGGFKLLYDNCDGFRDKINSFLGAIKDIFLSVVSFFKNNIIDPIVSFFTDLFSPVYENCLIIMNNIMILFNFFKEKIIAFFSPIIEWFGSVFQTAYTKITEVFASIGNWFGDRVNDIKNVFLNIAEWFGSVFQTAYTKITGIFASIGNWFGEKAQQAWNALKAPFSAVGSFFGGIFNTIKSKFTNIGQAVGDAIGGTFKKAINAVLYAAEKVINTPIKAINKLINKVRSIPGLGGLSTLNTYSFPRLKSGLNYVPNDFYGPVYLDEGERVLTKEENERYNAGLDTILQNSISNQTSFVTNDYNSSKLDRACELLEKIVDKDWSLYADTTEIAHAISSDSDQISGEMIELRERGLEL